MGKNQRIATVVVLVFIIAPFEPARAANREIHGRQINGAERENSAHRQRVALKIYRDFLLIAEGEIGGISGGQNFVIDTGTAPSIISLRVAAQLRLATTHSTFTALGKAVPMQAAVVPEIGLGPIRAFSLPVQVQDLSQLERNFGVSVAGIIGLDVLAKSSFHLDFEEKAIEFGEIPPEGIAIPYDSRAGLAVARMWLAGRSVRMLVDSGSDRIVLFGGNFAGEGWPRLRNTEQTGMSLADQRVAIQEFSAPDILVEGQHFSKDRVYFVPGSSDPAFDGLLGLRALGFRALSYDRASETVYLQK